MKPQFHKKWMRVSWVCAKVLLIGCVLYSTISGVWDGYKSYGDEATQKTPFFGIYNVVNFVVNKDTLPPLATDTSQWKTVSITNADYAVIKMMNDSSKGYYFAPDTVKKTINFFSYKDTLHKSLLAYDKLNDSNILIHGKLIDDSVSIVMQKINLNKLRLISRGFHWINEYPYNR